MVFLNVCRKKLGVGWDLS